MVTLFVSWDTKILLVYLRALLEMYVFALEAKKRELENKNLRVEMPNWSWPEGICGNILAFVKFEDRDASLLSYLFSNCPSGTGGSTFPVKGIRDEQTGKVVNFYSASASEMWGNHPYADNRRQILAECIEQLQTELRSRGIDV